MHKISKTLTDRVLARCETSLGSVSVLRSLAADGVPEKIGGKWVGEGRTLLDRGAHPDRATCATAGCDGLLDLGSNRGIVSMGRGPACPECGTRQWRLPSPDEVCKMRLALGDTRVGATLLGKAGRALGDVLDGDDAGAKVRAAIHVRQAEDPARFGDRKTVRHEGSVGLRAEHSWAGALRQEQVDALSPVAVEQLRQIAELQRMLDEQARQVVTADLEGRAHVVALPMAPLT